MTGENPLPGRVTVEAPARLHFGVLDLRGHRGRRFGGIGAAVPAPSVYLEAERSDRVAALGDDADRAREFAKRFFAYHRLEGGVQLRIHRAIPPHAGLGSGTQLGLAVARAIAGLYGLSTDPPRLAVAVGRGLRSGIGTWTFGLGGFVLEGGRLPGSDSVAPLLSRLPMPSAWQYVVAVPPGSPGLSGEAEARAFERLPPAPEREVERVAHLVLMQLLPALADAELPTFGAALSDIQRITGGWFAEAQGGAFASEDTRRLVEQMALWGAAGVGQSSWGPAVYGIVAGRAEAETLAGRTREWLQEKGTVHFGGFSPRGAEIREQGGSSPRD